MEETDLLKKLNTLQNKYADSQEEEKRIIGKMKEEIAESERKIKATYQEKINSSKSNTSSLEKELENYKKLLENYSTFDLKLIGDIIGKLVTLVEGEEYFYQETTHVTYDFETTVFGSESFKVKKNLSIIVKGNCKQTSYHDYDEQNDEVYRLTQNSQAFVLSESKETKRNVTFYKISNGKLKFLIDFKNMSYVKEFIDLVIQYRFENQIEIITEKELMKLMNKFIFSKRELIEKNYQKRALEKQEVLNRKLLHEQAKHNEELDQIELENFLQNGIPSRYSNNLIDRLEQDKDSNDIREFYISYEGESYPAIISYSEPLITSENIFISKINIKSFIKDYFDDSEMDPHFHGFCDIELEDDGLAGIVDISNLKSSLDHIIYSPILKEIYQIDKINDKYLRVLYLPNKGKYSHKRVNIYNWILLSVFQKDAEEKSSITSYITKWYCEEETQKLLTLLKEIELLSNLNERQLKLYKLKIM